MPPTKKASRVIPAQQRVVDDEEDEAAEAETTTANGGKAGVRPRRGWSAAKQVADSTSTFAQALKIDEKIQVVKFLEDDPYVNYLRHWAERSSPTGKVNRSYVCLRTFDRECPLCDIGDRPQAVSAFNVALIGDDGVASLKTWDCGPKILKNLEGYARDPKTAPLTKGYFLVSRTGKRGTVNYSITPASKRGLEEDYDIEPPTAADLAKFVLWTDETIVAPKLKDMEELAAEIAEED